jgi:ubiquinone/menaquinone biosynthesis C-methylase UbiE
MHIMLFMTYTRKKAVKKQFDFEAHLYLSKYLNEQKIRERDRILELVNSKSKYQRVLDIGCGPGTISLDLLAISEQVRGIDISPEMIKIATKRFEKTELSHKISFDVGDAENLKFSDQYFDAVFCLGVLRYFDSWENALKEIYRVLKPNGVGIFTFYSQYSPHWFSMCFLYRPLIPVFSLIKGRSLNDLITKFKAEPLPFTYRKFRDVIANIGFSHSKTLHSGIEVFPINTLFPKISTSIYLKTESAIYNSNKLGWLGSTCIVKVIK